MLALHLRRLLCLMALMASPLALAHPIPDVPVRSTFGEGGDCRIQVEVDPRCFDGDPEIAPSLLYSALKALPEAERTAMLAQAKPFVERSVEFHFDPSGSFTPDFTFEFTTHNAQPLTKEDDVVVMTGNWSGTVPAGTRGYRIYARPEGKLSVLFLNTLRGKEVERTMVLFPKETSFLLDLVGNSHATSPEAVDKAASGTGNEGEAAAVFPKFLWKGFQHVAPKGYAIILSVLAMVLLGRGLRPLLPQVAAFTAAHSLALWLGAMDWVHVPASIVQPAIAGGMVLIALGNVFQTRCTAWRLVLVAVFGLVHGFSFAEAFGALEPAAGSFPEALLGFNVGLEAGQLAVIAAAFLVTVWVRSARVYRWAIAIPGSLVIAVIGLWWMAGRLGWIGA